jgi:hypothetical protein
MVRARMCLSVWLLVTWLSTRKADPPEAGSPARASRPWRTARVHVGLGSLALDLQY